MDAATPRVIVRCSTPLPSSSTSARTTSVAIFAPTLASASRRSAGTNSSNSTGLGSLAYRSPKSKVMV